MSCVFNLSPDKITIMNEYKMIKTTICKITSDINFLFIFPDNVFTSLPVKVSLFVHAVPDRCPVERVTYIKNRSYEKEYFRIFAK